jgi:hypothetical protein
VPDCLVVLAGVVECQVPPWEVPEVAITEQVLEMALAVVMVQVLEMY